jgi:hypothetical protein
MTQADLARVLKVKRHTVNGWVKRGARPHPKTVEKLVGWSGGYLQIEDFYRNHKPGVILPNPKPAISTEGGRPFVEAGDEDPVDDMLYALRFGKREHHGRYEHLVEYAAEPVQRHRAAALFYTANHDEITERATRAGAVYVDGFAARRDGGS